ncbi:Preprotein translocase subunit SecG (TC 3.A.5.1.1) [Bathymodiolus heckerae thiotrophic gill symbiont]|uniref:preprotein translocase subunit SecG n=1 Tax=Bathymodiolus heckerae thiotrophic gill symbiont TaxID=1052212 RepID=UPI0010B6F9B6|nr:preprotein translocase subunit SecG [Bathymodiolus heckerae thiotrophic gill symbiont]CAC9434374.1 Protein translocase membrane subunit SecG [uncultured Gammaproteobacteria bacterium]SMN13169.1 Preprotein translocase subunit SecG (TC 3.A.5.1.1) [Bathymodiolus heckerae thiotrophic gill symbiont]
MSFQVILIVHILLALGLVALILMQHGKGADAGAAFGAGTSGSVFGARGANSFIYKLTAGVAIGFFLTSLTLAYLATNETSSTAEEPQSVMDQVLIDPTPSIDVPMIETKADDIPQ